MNLRTFVIAGALSIVGLAYGKPTPTDTRIPSDLHAVQPPAALPPFSLPDVSGNIVRSSDFLGNVLILRIWATWCPICTSEMPSAQKLYETFKDQNIKVVTISIDAGGAKTVVPFMRKHNYTLPVLIDSSMEEMTKVGIFGIPGTFIVNREGKVVAKGIGRIDFNDPEFRDFVQHLAK